MIRTFQIKRFQSHNNTRLSFCAGLNGIIGQPQAGKSVVVRALRWIAYNRPLGFRFHSDFSKKNTGVNLWLDDGSKIELNKGKSGSGTYVFTTPKGNEIKAKAASGVPDLVTQALNLSELNIQYQLDNPFLVTASPGEIARSINRITKAEKLDEWIKEISKRINVLNYQRDTAKGWLEDIIESLKPYEKLDELKEKIKAFEKAHDEVLQLRAERDNVEDILANIKDLENTIKHQQRYLKAKTFLDRIEKINQEQLDLQIEKTKIEAMIDLENQMGFAIREREDFIEEYIEAIKEEEVCPTCFNTLEAKDIRRITREIRSVKRRPRNK